MAVEWLDGSADAHYAGGQGCSRCRHQHRTNRYEEFSIEPGDLRALMAVINIELERRTEPVEEAIRSLRKALRKAKVH